MKKIIFSLYLLLSTLLSISQAPQSFNYQAVLRNTDGTIKANESIAVQIDILQGSTEGNSIYMEVHDAETNEMGLLNLLIGEGTTSDDLSTVDWADGPYFIRISVNGTPIGTSQMVSVPYALFAAMGNQGPQGEPGDTKWTENDSSISYTEGNVGIGTESPTEQIDVHGNARIQGNLIVEGSIVSQDLSERIDIIENLMGIGTLTDYEGNIYRTTRIGTQVWMAENLRTTTYNDGTPISLLNDTACIAPTSPGYCWYDNDSLTYSQIYGAIYNWFAVETEKLCPDGWHIPTIDEWNTLTEYIGGGETAGGKLKETGTSHWRYPNTGATDEYNFTALPGGYRICYGGFDKIGINTSWWSSTEENTFSAYDKSVYYRYENIGGGYGSKGNGYSVRCVKDK